MTHAFGRKCTYKRVCSRLSSLFIFLSGLRPVEFVVFFCCCYGDVFIIIMPDLSQAVQWGEMENSDSLIELLFCTRAESTVHEKVPEGLLSVEVVGYWATASAPTSTTSRIVLIFAEHR